MPSQDSESLRPSTQPPTERRLRTVFVLLVLTVFVVCCSPCVYAFWRTKAESTDAEAQLDRLPLPPEWSTPDWRVWEHRSGPEFGNNRYASIRREVDVPLPAEVVRERFERAVVQEGWLVATDDPYLSEAPSCDQYDACWTKEGYRLYLDVESEAIYADCAGSPAGCSVLTFEISYVPWFAEFLGF